MTDQRHRSWHSQAAAVTPAVLVVVTSVTTIAGALLWLVRQHDVADMLWAAATLTAVVPALWWVIGALRDKRIGVDVVAVLSLLGTLVVHQYLAGALIAIMLATGRTLDAAAQRRATRDIRALVEHAPRSARVRRGREVRAVPLDAVVAGDILVVAPGEVVPVDGRILESGAVLDESVLTGEPLPVHRGAGEPVRSGVVDIGGAIALRATATASDSTYAGIVRMAGEAGAENAPVVRLADRYAAWFLPLTLLVAGGAWVVTGSLLRAVAVLVVATPCPLLLAAPVAIVSGLSRAARHGAVVRSGAALETLGHSHTLVMDKTGTLTAGRPVVVDIVPRPGGDAVELLRTAASVEQLSSHVLAESIVTEALSRGLELGTPSTMREQPGIGVDAELDGHRVRVGALPQTEAGHGWADAVVNRARLDSEAIAWVCVDDDLAGALLLRDPLRRDAPLTIRRLRHAGLDRVVMLTGDRIEPAREVGTVLGLDDVFAHQSPADKVAAVRRERCRAVTVMVGDGVNDAPALAAADVGVAMGARGSTASSEAADVVLTTDRLDRLADAMDTARWSRRIAVQSAVVGMALSLMAMAAAAAGVLPPVAGAVLQEGIDLAVILNALRALRGDPALHTELPPETEALLHRFDNEHGSLRSAVALLRDAADRIADRPDRAALAAVEDAYRVLVDKVVPHEQAEESQLYPALATTLGGPAATATMSRAHAEIKRLTIRIGAHLDQARAAGELGVDHIEDLRACLYGLHALLQLHFVQEEENYFALADDLRPYTTPTRRDSIGLQNRETP